MFSVTSLSSNLHVTQRDFLLVECSKDWCFHNCWCITRCFFSHFQSGPQFRRLLSRQRRDERMSAVAEAVAILERSIDAVASHRFKYIMYCFFIVIILVSFGFRSFVHWKKCVWAEEFFTDGVRLKTWLGLKEIAFILTTRQDSKLDARTAAIDSS